MTFRIAAIIFAIAAGLTIVEPVQTSARGGGGFGGGHAMPAVGAFRAPVVHPGIAHTYGAPFAHFRHRSSGSVAVWGYPWYGGYGDGDYYVPSAVAPNEQPYPTADYLDARPRRLGCVTQTYQVPSEKGGEASVNVVRC